MNAIQFFSIVENTENTFFGYPQYIPQVTNTFHGQRVSFGIFVPTTASYTIICHTDRGEKPIMTFTATNQNLHPMKSKDRLEIDPNSHKWLPVIIDVLGSDENDLAKVIDEIRQIVGNGFDFPHLHRLSKFIYGQNFNYHQLPNAQTLDETKYLYYCFTVLDDIQVDLGYLPYNAKQALQKNDPNLIVLSVLFDCQNPRDLLQDVPF